MLLQDLRMKLIQIALRAQRENLIPLTFGNFSIRDKETGYICITPSGMEYSLLVPEDIVVVDSDCNIIDGKRKPSIEVAMHCMTFRERPDVFGIAHTHSTFATAWASCCEDIPAVVAEVAALVGSSISCAPYRPMGTIELAQVVVDYLKDKYAVLLANHGLLAVGPSIEVAYANAVIVEEGAKVAFYGKQIGIIKYIPDEECMNLRRIAMEKSGQ